MQALSSGTGPKGFLSFVLGLCGMARLSAEVEVSVEVEVACTGCGLQPGPAASHLPSQTRSCLSTEERTRDTNSESSSEGQVRYYS